MEETEHLEGRRLNLSDLHIKLFGEAFAEAHRAGADVMATYRCAQKLWEDGDLILPEPQ